MRNCRGILLVIVLSTFLIGRANSQYLGNTIPGTNLTPGEAIGIVVASAAAITVVTIVLVHNSHPTLKGCAAAGPEGVLLRNEGDQKVYALAGTTTAVKVGDVVKVQGRKYKKQKDSAGNETFMVTKIQKDYGSCAATTSPPSQGQ